MTVPATNACRSFGDDRASKTVLWVGYAILILGSCVFWLAGELIQHYVRELMGDKPRPMPIQMFLSQPKWILLSPLIWLPTLGYFSRSNSLSFHKAVLLVLLMLACLVIVGGIIMICGISICRYFVRC